MKSSSCILIVCLTIFACQRKNQPDDPKIWAKIKFNLSQFDEEGLKGPANGKTALNYEFCIPQDENLWQKVKKTDPTAQKSKAQGRVGCDKNTWLVVGSTHQKQFKKVLFELAGLPEVKEIREVFWE